MVDRVASRHPELCRGRGEKVLRLQPDIEWDKGHAVLWLLERLDLYRPGSCRSASAITSAMRMRCGRCVGIIVRGEDETRDTAAQYALADCDDVRRFLEELIALEPGRSS